MTTTTSARRARRLAAGALVALAAIVVALASCGTSTPEGTALDEPNWGGGVYGDAQVGARYVDVFTLLRTVDGRTITIDSVEWIGGTLDGIEILDVLISDASFQADLLGGYPPDRDELDVEIWERAENLRPVEGAEIEYRGKDAYNLAVPFEITKPGRWVRRAVRIYYTEQGKQYWQDIEWEFTMCTPEGLTQRGRCRRPSPPA